MIKILKQQIEIYCYKSSGPGGQRKNKKETAVKIKHLPTGITVIATENRSQAKNKQLALLRLQQKLKQLNKPKKSRIKTSTPKHVKEEVFKEKKILRGKNLKLLNFCK